MHFMEQASLPLSPLAQVACHTCAPPILPPPLMLACSPLRPGCPAIPPLLLCRYPPHWVPLPMLYEAMQYVDPVTEQPRCREQWGTWRGGPMSSASCTAHSPDVVLQGWLQARRLGGLLTSCTPPPPCCRGFLRMSAQPLQGSVLLTLDVRRVGAWQAAHEYARTGARAVLQVCEPCVCLCVGWQACAHACAPWRECWSLVLCSGLACTGGGCSCVAACARERTCRRVCGSACVCFSFFFARKCCPVSCVLHSRSAHAAHLFLARLRTTSM